MGPIYEMEGKSINIMEGDIVEIIFQRCVGSAVKSLTEPGGSGTTGVQPAEERIKLNFGHLRNSGHLQIVKSVGEHIDRVTDKVNVGHITRVLLAGL